MKRMFSDVMSVGRPSAPHLFSTHISVWMETWSRNHLQIPRSGSNAPAPGTQVSNQLSWCVCNNCRDMPTDVECKCCGQQPEACISILPHMAAYILQEGHLRLASRIWNDVRGLDDLPNRGESSKQLRHAAYRQYVMWQYGALGRGNRVVFPSCVVWRIRDCFPDLLGHYTGYIPGRVYCI
uniref:P2X purinoreceptor 7 intracellular domain-containing protein n=1 Tax=Gouania willdenowi TaxID=441366 RepID=A0A8C5GNW0_GOUWI